MMIPIMIAIAIEVMPNIDILAIFVILPKKSTELFKFIEIRNVYKEGSYTIYYNQKNIKKGLKWLTRQ